MRFRITLLTLIGVLLLGSGCSKYNRLLKGNDYAKKEEAAQRYFARKDYFRALGLYEQLQDHYGMTAKGEDILYYNAHCNFGLRNYTIAGYLFKTYFENYSSGIHAEEAYFMYANCIKEDTYAPELDQTNTYKAIEEFKTFALIYPDSKLISECNANIDQLRGKLMTKSYRTARLYYRIEDYKGAIICINNSLKDYPDLPQREELMFLLIKSNYLLFKVSVEDKRKERLEGTQEAYRQFVEEFGDKSRFRKEADQLNNLAEGQLRKYKKSTETTTN